jgi:EAL domain-containing protein (putative c-di-GMP-specific phosphodiesterase class I)
MEGELRRALECGELELHYQPKFDLQSGALLGAEALMRWNHPQRGMVPPLSFIPMAEDTGLIVPMGSWALKEACATVTRWNTGRAAPLKMAVNLSARQFASSDFQATVCDTLGETDCQPAWLELEITESLLLEGRPEVRALLEDLSTMGISIAIDDFGTGYSALSYLTRFPVDTLKIDRAFVKGLPGDRSNGELVKAIISLGHSLGMVIVAEGVETSEQGDALRLLGCEMVQGYLFGKPMSSSAFDALLAKHSTAE